MRLYLLPLLLLSAAAPLAHADTFQFTFSGNYVPEPVYTTPFPDSINITWQISGPPVPFLYDGQYPGYEFASVPVSGSAIKGTFNLLQSASGLDFLTIGDYPYNVYGIAGVGAQQPFATGPDSNPIFLPGTYVASFEYLPTYSIYDGSLIVSDLSTGTTPTPEPSTLLLLVTGLATAARLVRRRPSPMAS